MFSSTPVVYAVGSEYQIFLYTRSPAYVKILIGEKEFDDCVCGVKRSAKGMRRISVPKALLDGCGEYTVIVQHILKRVAYCTKITRTTKKKYVFRPVATGETVRAYMVGDSHGDEDIAVKAAQTFGKFDFLILNGDIPNKCDNVRDFETAHNIAAKLTGGTVPVVFAKGNHENRGAAAELMFDYIPLNNSRTYYTFHIGSIWGLVLDCGEDKVDDNREYGSSVCFHSFREEQTEYIRRVIADAGSEYEADGVEHRIVVVHVPFVMKMGELFSIEEEIYGEWTELLRKINPDAIISAHTHRFRILRGDDESLR
ncbi:MAG: metallophosphoesterase, partial [Clostridia bacterium]|nr:metallophosphoesterase [Clostridia bacterium]